MGYLSIQDISDKWNISKRRAQILCKEGRVDGAKMIGNIWVVPEDAERPIDARTKNPIIETKRNHSFMRSDLKKLLKKMYKRSGNIKIQKEDRKIYVLSVLSGILCSLYIDQKNCEYHIIRQIYKDLQEKTITYVIDDEMIRMASDFILLYQDDEEIGNIVSWAYQYSNKIDVSSDYCQTQFFTEKYMVDYLVKHIKEIISVDKILDPCSGGGNFLVECLELLCKGCRGKDLGKKIIAHTEKLYGYDIDEVIAKLAVVNIRIKAISIIHKKNGAVSFDIWEKICPNIFCAAEKDMSAGSLAKDNRKVRNVITGKLVPHKTALGNAGVIVTNPPFASSKGMSEEQKKFLKKNYPLANCDTCVAFMEAVGSLLSSRGVCGMVTQNAWMHLQTYSKARDMFVQNYRFRNITNLGSGAFIDLSGEKSNVSLIVFEKSKQDCMKSIQIQNLSVNSLSEKKTRLQTEQDIFEICQNDINGPNGFILSEYNAMNFQRIGSEIYSMTAVPMQGTSTGNSKELVGYFWEHFGDDEWIPVSKGGGYCRWEGLNSSVVKWGIDGEYIRKQKGSALRNVKYFGETQLVFSDTGTAGLNVRLLLDNQIFIASGPGIRVLTGNKYAHMAFLNSRLAAYYVRTISPKLTIAAGYIGRIPVKISLFNSVTLERKARLCVELKHKYLRFRPNNFEYTGMIQTGSEMDIEEQAEELFKNDLLNELLKLEIESQCDELILSEYEMKDDERKALNEAVGECAFNIKTVREVEISKLDKYLVKILDDACMLKRSRASKNSLGCDGMLEFVSKDLDINPSSLVEQICQNPFLMHFTLEKYKDLIIHNWVLQIMGYSVVRGVFNNILSILDVVNSFENMYGTQMDIKTWMEKKFNSIHSGIFKGKPFLRYEDGEIKIYGR